MIQLERWFQKRKVGCADPDWLQESTTGWTSEKMFTALPRAHPLLNSSLLCACQMDSTQIAFWVRWTLVMHFYKWINRSHALCALVTEILWYRNVFLDNGKHQNSGICILWKSWRRSSTLRCARSSHASCVLGESLQRCCMWMMYFLLEMKNGLKKRFCLSWEKISKWVQLWWTSRKVEASSFWSDIMWLSRFTPRSQCIQKRNTFTACLSGMENWMGNLQSWPRHHAMHPQHLVMQSLRNPCPMRWRQNFAHWLGLPCMWHRKDSIYSLQQRLWRRAWSLQQCSPGSICVG